MKKQNTATAEVTITKPEAPSPDSLLKLAIEKGASIEQLEKLMDLQDRHEKKLSKSNFLMAISIFQSDCPVIKKSKKVAFGNTKYSYAPLGEIASQIKEVLKKNGLSYRWEMKDETDKMVCTCIVSHIDGHSEQTTMSAAKDSSGSKNEIQQRGSTITYLQRYTLISVLGISTADEDIDAQPKEEVKEGQVEKDLKELLELKKAAIAPEDYRRAKEVLRKKEVASYDKLKAFLQTK